MPEIPTPAALQPLEAAIRTVAELQAACNQRGPLAAAFPTLFADRVGTRTLDRFLGLVLNDLCGLLQNVDRVTLPLTDAVDPEFPEGTTFNVIANEPTTGIKTRSTPLEGLEEARWIALLWLTRDYTDVKVVRASKPR